MSQLRFWVLAGPQGQIIGPEMNGMFVSVLFLTEGDAEAALGQFNCPPGTQVRRARIMLDPVGSAAKE